MDENRVELNMIKTINFKILEINILNLNPQIMVIKQRMKYYYTDF